MERSLTAFKTIECNPAPCGLALAAARSGLAFARADAAPNPLRPVMCAGIVTDLVELHRANTASLRSAPHPHSSSTTRTRCLTLSIIPRTAGVSSSTRRRRSLLRPSPFSVARWSGLRPIGLAVCTTVTDFLLSITHSRGLRHHRGQGFRRPSYHGEPPQLVGWSPCRVRQKLP